MLSKEVCRRCELRLREDLVSEGNESFVKEFPFEALWEVGVVYCTRSWWTRFSKFRASRILIKGGSPRRCPYLTEHVVSQDAE